MEEDVDKLPDPYFSKSAAIIFDKIDNGEDGILPPSRFVYLIETLGDGFHNEYLAGHLSKVYPNESDSLDRFDFVRWYVVEEVFLDSAEEAENLLGWACKVSLMDVQI